jgi:hypothetical protein
MSVISYKVLNFLTAKFSGCLPAALRQTVFGIYGAKKTRRTNSGDTKKSKKAGRSVFGLIGSYYLLSKRSLI